MRNRRDMHWVTKAALFALLYGASVFALSGQSMMKSAAPPASPAQISGTIATIEGNMIFVTAKDGSATTVSLGKDVLILARKSATLASIRPGEAMGVTSAKAADGSQTATAINVFPPELWQKVRKGQWMMDNGLYMTNAQVDRTTAGVQGRTLFMKYEMLTAAISVPNSADIRRSTVKTLADLKPGLVVTVRGSAGTDGVFAASFLSFDLPD